MLALFLGEGLRGKIPLTRSAIGGVYPDCVTCSAQWIENKKALIDRKNRLHSASSKTT